MGQIKHKRVFRLLEQLAPKSLAYDWDNVGLQVGSENSELKNILITLDVTEAVVDEAIKAGASLIIAHHPLLFTGIHSINIDSVKGRIIKKLIDNDMTVYAAHTNLDIAKGGVNDLLAEAINLDITGNLVNVFTEKLFKLVVFVPVDSAEVVKSALGESGAGHIGNYSHCSFSSSGTGSFLPEVDSNPFIGSVNELTVVEEVKIETIIREKDIQSIVHAMKLAHPYEEVAYDLYELHNKGESLGLGRIGKLPSPVMLADFCKQIKSAYQMDQVRVTGDLTKEVQRVAVLGGSGEKFINHAIRNRADVYITGDITYHMAQDAEAAGLAVIDAGHYIEKIMKSATKTYLEKHLPNGNLNVIESNINTDPFRFV